ncbi:MAG: hypothetical protein WC325_09135 [Candidatus Bathyarchaeia archaeon]|jgi:hypothetical protein
MSIRNFEYVELLEIAVAVGCPNTCLRYCPQEVLNRAYGKGVRVMSFESFKKMGFRGERLRFENRWSVIAERHFRVYQAVGASNSVTAKRTTLSEGKQ